MEAKQDQLDRMSRPKERSPRNRRQQFQDRGGRNDQSNQPPPRRRKRSPVRTTLGASVTEDIERAREKVLRKKRQKEAQEEAKRKKSQRIRKIMRKKFAHIKAIERPLSPRRAGEMRVTKRDHVEKRRKKASEIFASALRTVRPWSKPLKHVFKHYVAILEQPT